MLPPKRQKEAKPEGRWKSSTHLAFVRSFCCAIPGCQGVPVEAAHVRNGSDAGMGRKPSDYYAAPLCKGHHAQQHNQGETTFWDTYQRASGQSVADLIAALCKASPKAREIMAARNG